MGTELRASISEIGPSGCGTAIGPVSFLSGGEFQLDYDEARSRDEEDSRTIHWASAGSVSQVDCAGDYLMMLYGVETETIEQPARGRLSVGYSSKSESPSCPKTCGMTNFIVDITKLKRK